MLRAGDANGQRESDLLPHASANRYSDVSRCSEEMDGAGNIEECLIYRHALDSRGEVMKDGDDIVAELLVAVEVATDEQQITTELAGPPPWHAAADAIASGFVRCRQHHTAADGDRPV